MKEWAIFDDQAHFEIIINEQKDHQNYFKVISGHSLVLQGVGRKQVGTLSDMCSSFFVTDGMEPDLMWNNKWIILEIAHIALLL